MTTDDKNSTHPLQQSTLNLLLHTSTLPNQHVQVHQHHLRLRLCSPNTPLHALYRTKEHRIRLSCPCCFRRRSHACLDMSKLHGAAQVGSLNCGASNGQRSTSAHFALPGLRAYRLDMRQSSVCVLSKWVFTLFFPSCSRDSPEIHTLSTVWGYHDIYTQVATRRSSSYAAFSRALYFQNLTHA